MDPFARDLLEQTRHAHDPLPGAADRVHAKLAARVGAGPGGKTGGAGAGAGALPMAVKLGLPLLGGVAVLAYLLAPRPVPQKVETVPQAAPEVAVTASPVADSPSQPPSPPSAAPPPEPPPAASPSVVRRAAVPTSAAEAPARPGLDAEMALVASAQAAMQRGDYTAALARLDEHQHEFPNGVLAEERTAARVVALCGAGRDVEARALATAFLTQHPTSPLAPRVRGSCARP